MFLVIDENFDNFNNTSNKSNFMLNGTSTITPNSMLNDPNLKYLDKIIETSHIYKDYIRLGLITACSHPGVSLLKNLDKQQTTFNKDESEEDFDVQQRNNLFRICTLNSSYQLCKSYPALFIVSKETTDECIKKNSKCHRQNRLPIIVWKHPVNKALLIRGAGFLSKGFIGMIIKGQTASG